MVIFFVVVVENRKDHFSGEAAKLAFIHSDIYQNFSMEVVTAIVGSAVTEAGKCLCGSYPNIKNFISFKSNISTLEKEMKSLLDLKNKVKEDAQSSNGQMTPWLLEVEKIMLEWNSVQACMTANDKNLCGCFFSCSKRYTLSKETARILKDVERLLKEGHIAAKVVRPKYMAKAVVHIPGPSIGYQNIASLNLAKIMDLLNNDDVLRIGVWGMGGVGKTTLVKTLNNNLKDSSSTQPFDIVIWATVSQKLNLRKVQIQLAERLNLDVKLEESVESLAIKLHRRLQDERFLLILDDVWETIDLDSLGVPQPAVHTGSKIILTCRSLEVCREMKTDKEVKVDILNDEESWQLFTINAGKVATVEHIEPTARAVARECNGLPLAIITVGTAMRGKTMIELWKHALSELRRSVPYIKGVETKVYKPLKWSYDSLQGKYIKPCFLYCSLYPEDYSIKVSELVNCWLGEGLIDEQQNHEDSYNRGISLIENLKDSCLLEDGAYKGTVKMHDVVRDVAIWISSSLEDRYKSLVRSGIGLTQISEAEMSESLKRISFMHNKITELPDCEICCPETMSVLLQGNSHLSRIPDEFLQAFLSLRVLNLSGSNIQLLPQSILKLGELRVLLLRNCYRLDKLPQLGIPSKLQVLDCANTSIRELPSGLQNLQNLRQLYLSHTKNLETIEGGIISRLSSLEILDMTNSAYIWAVQTTFRELLSLEHLVELFIKLDGIPTLGSRDRTWLARLRRCQLFFRGPRSIHFLPTELVGKMVKIIGHDLSNGFVSLCMILAPSVFLDDCCSLGSMHQNLAANRIDCFAGLKSLTITNCIFLFGRYGTREIDLLPNIQELRLLDVTHLQSISELTDNYGLSLSRLRKIEIARCPQFQYLLWLDSPRLNAEKLEVVKVSFCDKLEQLFLCTPEINEADQVNVVLNLRIIEVANCKALKKLPLRNLNPDTIQEIRGDQLWWNKLDQGSDENTKLLLQRFFKPVRDSLAKPLFKRTVTGISRGEWDYETEEEVLTATSFSCWS